MSRPKEYWLHEITEKNENLSIGTVIGHKHNLMRAKEKNMIHVIEEPAYRKVVNALKEELDYHKSIGDLNCSHEEVIEKIESTLKELGEI